MKPLHSFALILLALIGCAAPPEPLIYPAKVIEQPRVAYPTASRRYEEEGTVVVRIQVLANGQIGERTVKVSSGHSRLDTAALEAARTLKAIPASTQSGRTADSNIELPLVFRLEPMNAATSPLSYAARIQAAIKPNIQFSAPVSGNPPAVVELVTAPDGQISRFRLVHSSGIAAWDSAVLNAVQKTAAIPLDTDGRVPPKFEISFYPNER